MNSIDLTPLYRNSIGFDRLAALIDNSFKNADSVSNGYPPYNIEVIEENRYSITLALAGFTESDLDIQVEKGILSVRGKKTSDEPKQFLHRGIANRSFERKFNLADHVEVTGAELANGLLTVNLKKEIPEAMKPRTIEINQQTKSVEYNSSSGANDDSEAA